MRRQGELDKKLMENVVPTVLLLSALSMEEGLSDGKKKRGGEREGGRKSAFALLLREQSLFFLHCLCVRHENPFNWM